MNKLLKQPTAVKLMYSMKRWWPGIVAVIFVGWAALALWSGGTPSSVPEAPVSDSPQKVVSYWTCSMHPQIRLPKAGQCPICGMNLIPVYAEAGSAPDEEAVSLRMNPVARQLAEVETVPVRYQEVAHEIGLVGTVEYDETRVANISAWVGGRIDRIFVDFTGIKVHKNDHLLQLYSPELLAAQQEYIQALKNVEQSKKSELQTIRDSAQATVQSVREKLRLFGIDEAQIAEIARLARPQEHLLIRSPVMGTVIHKNGFSGMYVKTGDTIYTIADLSRVWLFLDVYESDIEWVRYGQPVTVEAESYPGEIFHGRISFVDSVVDEKTRTVKLRVNVDNAEEKLKPGMFVRATITAEGAAAGTVFQEDLAGKWICPMHPEVVKDAPGKCDECGMDLVSTRQFGFADHPVPSTKAFVIPRSAPLITGKRAVVYVEHQDDGSDVFSYEGREVVLGPLAGDSYIVRSGLREGERVVTKGNFKIDSALQIQAKPSMMNPGGYYHTTDSIISSNTVIAPDATDSMTERSEMQRMPSVRASRSASGAPDPAAVPMAPEAVSAVSESGAQR